MFLFNEIVRASNSTARIKNYYPESGLVVLFDISGTIEAGLTLIGDESGFSLTLSSFEISDDYDLNYGDETLINNDQILIALDTGEYIAQDAHFTGLLSQEYQTEYLITI